MHLTKLPSGSWRVAVKHKGRRRTATAPTKDAARLLGHELELELGVRKRTAEHVTVGDLLDLHMLSVKDEWSPTTWHDANSLAKRLPEPFRERTVTDVDAAVIAGLYRELTRDGWSAHRIRRVRLILSTAWTTAISYRWAVVNPTRDARMPKLPHREITPPDADTVDRIIAATSGQFELFLRLAAATGARRGELVALRWTDVNLDADRATIRITHSLVWTPGDGPTERDTKTAVKGHRTIKLGASLTKRLLEHRDLQADNAADQIFPVYVFSHTAGATPWRPDYVSREFARVCKKAGVTGVRLHDLRHYLITSMLTAGDSIQAAASRAGHSSTATTARVYSHWLAEPDELADRIDQRHG